jgi:hypothetical protein
MLALCLLTLSSLYLIFTTIGAPFPTISYALGKTIVSCLVTSIGITPLDILIPWVAASCSTT